MEYRSPVCRARICRKSPLIFQHPSFILARRNNRHHFRVSSRMMPMPPGYTKVFGFAPTWCTTKYLARSCGVFFIAVFRKAGAWCAIGGENSSCISGCQKTLVRASIARPCPFVCEKTFLKNALMRQVLWRPMVAPTHSIGQECDFLTR